MLSTTMVTHITQGQAPLWSRICEMHHTSVRHTHIHTCTLASEAAVDPPAPGREPPIEPRCSSIVTLPPRVASEV
jgi:hypothetical protein